jgi:AcrR family transcriptional regulator
MAGKTRTPASPRITLNREQVLTAAIGLADESGIEALSMRRLGRALGVEAMSLYNHVAGKDDLLDGMVDLVWGGVTLPPAGGEWKAAIRTTAVSAHQILLRHPWACHLVISRPLPTRLRYIDAILGRLHNARFPPHLTYYAYHAIDSHIIGFTMWHSGHSITEDRRAALEDRLTGLSELFDELPHLRQHTEQHRTGLGRDGPDEFTFALDFILTGLDRARRTG